MTKSGGAEKPSSLVTRVSVDQTIWLRRLFTLFLAAWTVILFFHLVNFFVYTSPNQDQTWLLYAAQRVLGGARLYGSQVVESNPPLIVWFSTVPVFIAHLFHLDSVVMLKLFVALMIAGSVAWCGRILRAAGAAQSPAGFYFALFSILSAEVSLSGYDSGQREHLLIILILPYVVSAICGRASRLPRVEFFALGIAAGLAVCLKPQQILILIGLEIFLAAWNRSLRRLGSPDLLAAIVTVFVYIALVRLVTPLYFSTIVPLLRQTYWAFGSYSIWSLIKMKASFGVVFLAVLAIFLWRKHTLQFPIATGAFLSCSLAASLAFDLQHKGWSYQFDPQRAFLLLAILSLLADLFSPAVRNATTNWKFDRLYAAVTIVLILMLLAPFLNYARRGARLEAARRPYPAEIMDQYPPQTTAYVFTTDLRDSFPATAQDHLIWASRFNHLWMLPAIVENEQAQTGGPTPQKLMPPATVQQLAALLRGQITEDFQRWKPAVVIVKRCSKATPCLGMEGVTFDPLPWFLQSPGFAAQWANYRLQQSHGDFEVYTRVH